MHSANRKSVRANRLNHIKAHVPKLTFVSGHEVLDVFRNVLVEMQLADIERLDDGAIVQHQQSRVAPHLKTITAIKPHVQINVTLLDVRTKYYSITMLPRREIDICTYNV